MPRPLPHETEKVCWRIRADDLALLEVMYAQAEGGVNGFVRELIHAYCTRVVNQRKGSSNE